MNDSQLLTILAFMLPPTCVLMAFLVVQLYKWYRKE